ncbi:MAG: hypothetical protein K5896_13875 [Prevotella sp.]|nr:hypothetical protein [Prevotella sp.]
MALISEVQERSWAGDKYGDKVKSWKWDWRDTRIMAWINSFERISREDTEDNMERLSAIRTGALKRSLWWKTWATSGGDTQVFAAKYLYYAKFVELAVGKGDPYDAPVPNIPAPFWAPIPVPTRRRKGKPFVVTEMRTQATKFTSMARREFCFAGTMFMVYAMGDNQDAHDAVNRALFRRQRRGMFDR